MKKILFPVLGVAFLFLVALTACSNNQAQVDKLTADNQALTSANQKMTADNQQLKLVAGPPPASLDQYYPPASPAPVWFIDMLNMAGPFGGIGAGLQSGNMTTAKASFTAFQSQYTKMSTMVPEWTSRFKLDTVTALGAAIDGGNPAQVGPAMAAVGQACTDCHLLDRVKVEQKYYWRDFDTIKVTDPVSGKSMGWVDYMTAMAGNYEGTMGALQGGNQAAAVGAFSAFTSQLKTLGTDGCSQCHVDPVTKQIIPRNYFVDAASMAVVDQMSKALSATPPDAATAGKLAQVIANDICTKCHLVHFQAQNAKDLWSTYSSLLK